MIIEPILAAFLGLTIGVLINYLADVLPMTRRFTQPTCQKCGEVIKPLDYLLGRGCLPCEKRAPYRYWIVNFLSLVITVWLYVYPNSRLGFWPSLILLVYFGLVALIDIETRLILHPVSLLGALLGFAVGTWLHGLVPTLLGGAAGFLIMLMLYYLGDWFARFLARLRGQTLDEIALGFGDVNLSAILGLLLGWPGILAGLFLAILLGGLVSLAIIVSQLFARRYQPFTAIPYAPFLILGAILLIYR